MKAYISQAIQHRPVGVLAPGGDLTVGNLRYFPKSRSGKTRYKPGVGRKTARSLANYSSAKGDEPIEPRFNEVLPNRPMVSIVSCEK